MIYCQNMILTLVIETNARSLFDILMLLNIPIIGTKIHI